MTTNRITHRWLAWLAGTMVLAGMVLALAPDRGPAQTKKTDAKAKTKTDKSKTKTETTDPAKTAKVEPPPATYPKRVDLVDGTRGGTEQVTYIDELILKGWKDNKRYPSDRCSDHEFIRRASLDIIGRIPTVKEVNDFMKQSEKLRRSWLINVLLDSEEYAQDMANRWTVHLMTRRGSGKHYQAEMNDWLYKHFKGTSSLPADWSKIAFELISAQGETGDPNDKSKLEVNNAVNYMLHNLGDPLADPKSKQADTAKYGKWDMVPATSRTTRLFLGIRTQCVQCHDHPFNGEWKQADFWGINAFLRQIEPSGRPTMMMKKKKGAPMGTQEYTLKDNLNFNTPKLVQYERRNTVLMFTDPRFLDGREIPENFKGTRREALAKFIIESPWFAKAFVNRMWGHFFGKSFTRDGVDDFHAEHPISHPELLDKLSDDWAKKYKHNPKDLIRWICNSQAYSLSSRANKWNDDVKDETLFLRMLLKPMSPEQMFESVMVATEAKLEDDAKEKWLDRLVVNFGNDEGEEAYSGTVIQALLLMNGQDINNVISGDKEGALSKIIKRYPAGQKVLDPRIINDMYIQVLSRPPSKKERDDMMSAKMFLFSGRSKTGPASPQFWNHYYQDIFWALLNSNEFILNH